MSCIVVRMILLKSLSQTMSYTPCDNMVFNAIFNNISVISWQAVLSMSEVRTDNFMWWEAEVAVNSYDHDHDGPALAA
jgi:hypothetical protein